MSNPKNKKIPVPVPGPDSGVGDILAYNVDMLMAKNGWSQEDVRKKAARHGKIAQKTVSNVLRREHSIQLRHLDTLAKVFGVSPIALISLEMTAERSFYRKDRQEHHEALDDLDDDQLSVFETLAAMSYRRQPSREGHPERKSKNNA